jgi:hypothetical protein
MEAMMDCRSDEVPKHTPGPWEYRKMPKSGYIVFQTWDVPTAGYVKTEADAQLIAAAPEMLEALKEIMRRAVYNPEYNDWEIVMKESFLQHNVQLIAKAEGRQP